jgi:hypothetical protein
MSVPDVHLIQDPARRLYWDEHSRAQDEIKSRKYSNEKEYVRSLIPGLEKWFKVTPAVQGLHFTGAPVQFDLLLEPTGILKFCQFPWFVIEAKYMLFTKSLGDATNAYLQALEYRNAVVLDRRFEDTPIFNKRPPAVMVCSDLIDTGNPGRVNDVCILSRAFGRRGVYSCTLDDYGNFLCYTKHGLVFTSRAMTRVNLKNHTALRTNGGVAEKTDILFLLRGDEDPVELTTAVKDAAVKILAAELPEHELKDKQ